MGDVTTEAAAERLGKSSSFRGPRGGPAESLGKSSCFRVPRGGAPERVGKSSSFRGPRGAVTGAGLELSEGGAHTSKKRQHNVHH